MFLCSRATRVAHFRASLLRLCSSVVPVSDSSCRLCNRKQAKESWHGPRATSGDTMLFGYRVTLSYIYQPGILVHIKQERFKKNNSLPYELCRGTTLQKANCKSRADNNSQLTVSGNHRAAPRARHGLTAVKKHSWWIKPRHYFTNKPHQKNDKQLAREITTYLD